jgi:hypothetical protein
MRTLLLTKYMWKTITFHCLPSSRCKVALDVRPHWRCEQVDYTKSCMLHWIKVEGSKNYLYIVHIKRNEDK